jgi:hypothetical protein
VVELPRRRRRPQGRPRPAEHRRERQTLTAAKWPLRATQDALDSIPTEAPADAILNFANALQAAISGRVDASGTMAGDPPPLPWLSPDLSQSGPAVPLYG